MATNTAFELTTFGDLDLIPSEIVLMTVEFLGPLEMYNFMVTCKRLYRIIIKELPHFVSLYAKTSRFEVERFMWGSFYNENQNFKDKYQLYFAMVDVYRFSTTTNFEQTLSQYFKVDYYITSDYPKVELEYSLPEDPTELYIIKFQAGILSILGQQIPIIASTNSQSCNNIEIFKFMFKFILKYPKIAIMFTNCLNVFIERFIEKFNSFEEFEKRIKRILRPGVSETKAYLQMLKL